MSLIWIAVLSVAALALALLVWALLAKMALLKARAHRAVQGIDGLPAPADATGPAQGSDSGRDDGRMCSSPAHTPLDDNVQFTVYRPGQIQPLKWYPLLAFAHLSAKRPHAPGDDPEPLEEVTAQARRALGEQQALYQPLSVDSRSAVPQAGVIALIPSIEGIEFNPTARTFAWEEDVHREEFRLRASPELEGQTCRGQLTVFLGAIILAEVPLAISVDSACHAAPEEAPTERSEAACYRRIFASYSHKDAAIAQHYAEYARALGDRYVIDVADLNAGETWCERLRELIGQADIFQLFWSWNAMDSEFVRQEYEWALGLGRPHFVRPTYWEDPLPERPPDQPPEALHKLHFQRLHLPPADGSAGNGSQVSVADPSHEPGAAQTCPCCGANTNLSSRFCGRCGTSLSAGQHPREGQERASLQEVFAHIRAGEQRPAVVLMADVSGFTSLGEVSDPEWLFHLINEVFEELVEIVIAHGGHIDKYVGDELVALFGVPVAQERAAERALCAALAMCERLRLLNDGGAFAGTLPQIHIGVNLGPVLVGPVGHRTHADYTVIGDTVNVAKRLEDEAKPGEILVTGAVLHAAGGDFETENVGLIELSGRGIPTEVFRLIGMTAGRTTAGHAPDTGAVGREHETAQLNAAGQRAAAGEQTSLYIVGGAGIGKSYLVHQWCRHDGVEFSQVQTRCRAFGQHFPLLPVADLTAQLLGLHVESWPPRVVGEVRRTLEDTPLTRETCEYLSQILAGLDGIPPEHAGWPDGFAAALAELLSLRTQERPVCLVLEDAQWIDEASRIVLDRLLERSPRWRVLVLVTSRDGPTAWPLQSARPDVLALAPLSDMAMEQLIQAWARPMVLSPETVRAVSYRANGYPYSARELVQELRRQTDGNGHGEVSLPGTLQELFLARLDRLDIALRRLVQAASVVGEPLPQDLLRAVMPEAGSSIQELLRRASSEGLLREGAVAGEFAFGPALLFETAYGTIPPSTRRTLHARLADDLGTRPGIGLTGLVHVAAHHAYLGYGDERALDLLLRSARLYSRQGMSREVLRLAQQVLQLVGRMTDPSLYTREHREALIMESQARDDAGV